MSETADWRQSPRRRVEVAAIAGLGYPALRALGSSWTWRVSGAEYADAIAVAGHRPILALWHGRILPAALYFQHRGIVAMASENFDGEWIARILGRFGFGAARGSTSRGGAAALRQLARDVRAHGVAFTVDGPRGPAGVAQRGAVWLSRATGQPLLPFHCEAASSWTVDSWDRTLVPKPFTTVAMAIAPPIFVAPGGGDQALDASRIRLEEALRNCQARCAELLCP